MANAETANADAVREKRLAATKVLVAISGHPLYTFSLENRELDKVPIWMDRNGKTFLVTYMAVRDGEGNYLGTMELVQDVEFAKEYFTK